MGARVVVVALLLAVGLTPAAAGATTLKKGSLTLKACGDVKGWWCGSLPRALDPAKPHGPHIGIDFRWRPPAGGKAKGPALVAVEGGPGYPSTGSRVEYTGIYGRALLNARGLLLVDNRGTGTSDLIDCKSVQDFAGVNTTTAFAKRVEACARQIERHHPGAHAADLYRHGLRRQRSRRRDREAQARARRPLRRLIRDVLQPVVHGAAPRAAALGRPRLGLPRARPRPVVRLVGDDGAQRDGRRLRP